MPLKFWPRLTIFAHDETQKRVFERLRILAKHYGIHFYEMIQIVVNISRLPARD